MNYIYTYTCINIERERETEKPITHHFSAGILSYSMSDLKYCAKFATLTQIIEQNSVHDSSSQKKKSPTSNTVHVGWMIPFLGAPLKHRDIAARCHLSLDSYVHTSLIINVTMFKYTLMIRLYTIINH